MSDSPATPAQHDLVAEAVAARLAKVIPLPERDDGSAFDRAMRDKLAKIEQAPK